MYKPKPLTTRLRRTAVKTIARSAAVVAVPCLVIGIAVATGNLVKLSDLANIMPAVLQVTAALATLTILLFGLVGVPFTFCGIKDAHYDDEIKGYCLYTTLYYLLGLLLIMGAGFLTKDSEYAHLIQAHLILWGIQSLCVSYGLCKLLNLPR